MLTKPSQCQGCPLYTIGTGFSEPEGSGINKILIVGEALGANEANDGLPFRPYADAGAVLERAIRMLGCDREQFVLWNICACKPPNNELSGAWYEQQAEEHCKVHFRRVMERYKPRVILACGGVPIKVLTGYTGYKMGVEMLQGYILPAIDYPGVHVVCNYHPSYVQRGQWALFQPFVSNMSKALQLAHEGYKEETLRYSEDASTVEVEEYIEYLEGNPDKPLSVDFETRGEDQILGVPLPDKDDIIDLISTDFDNEDTTVEEFLPSLGINKSQRRITVFQDITQVNLSVEIGSALAIQYNDDTAPVVKRAMATQNIKTTHNGWMFDEPVAVFNGCPMSGRVEDTIWRFHHIYPDLPGVRGKVGSDGNRKDDGALANLQFCASMYRFPFPWKHMRGEREGYYGCCDADSDLRIYYGTEESMVKLKIREGYETFVQRVWPYLKNASAHGIYMDVGKLTAFVRKLMEMEKECLAKINPLIPQAVLPTKQKAGLKTVPKDTTGYVLRTFAITEPEPCSCVRVKKAAKCKKCDGMGGIARQTGFGTEEEIVDCTWCKGTGQTEPSKTWDTTHELCKGTGELFGDVQRYCKLLEFKPNSPAQLREYVRYRGYRVPKNSKKKFAMDRETIERLAKTYNDPVFNLIIESRKLGKMRGTYGAGWLARLRQITPQEVAQHADDPEYAAYLSELMAAGIGTLHTTFSFLPATGQLSSSDPNVQNCFSLDTEILTKRGWVRFDCLSNSDDVAQYDADTELISFVRPSRVVRAPFDGAMKHIHTDEQIDMMVTPNHECLVRNRKTLAFSKVRPDQYPKDAHQICAGVFCESPGDVDLRWWQAALLCAVQADANVAANGRIDLVFYKSRKIERAREALDASGINYTESVKVQNTGGHVNGTRFVIKSGDVPKWLQSRKYFGPWLLELCSSSLLLMREEVFFWDGCWSRRSMYSSSVKSNADWVQILCLLTGVRGRIRSYHNGNQNSIINWQVDTNYSTYSMTTNRRVDDVPYKGLVYCVTVPTGNVVTRYGKCVAITGNSPNPTKHGQLGYEFRDAIVAGPGQILFANDYKSFHVQTFAWEAKDWDLLRLAKIDAHSYLTAHMIHDPDRHRALTWDDEKLAAYLAAIKKAHKKLRDGKAKPALLGYDFGMGPGTLFALNRDSFDNFGDAEQVINTLNGLFPKGAKFRETVPLRAKKNGHHLRSVFGCLRWFWHIEKYDHQKREWKHGDDWEKAIAYLPANDAFCIKKLAMHRIGERDLDRFGFIIDIHDELFFRCLKKDYEEARYTVKRAMETPCDQMLMPDGTGFWVETEAKTGETWATMQ